MKTDSQPQYENASPMPGAFVSRPWIRRAGISIVSLSTAVALFYGVENWRGARAWSTTLAELKATGAKLSYADFAGTPVPDDQNMIMHPAFRCFTFTRADGTRARRLEGDSPDGPDKEMAARWDSMMKEERANRDLFDALQGLWETPKPDSAARRGIVDQLRPVMARHEELLAAVTEACLRPTARWPLAEGPGDTPGQGWLSASAGPSGPGGTGLLLELSRMCAARAFLFSTDGDTDNAWRQALSAGRIPMVLTGGMSTMWSLLFAAALQTEETGIVARLLEDSTASPANCAAYEQTLALRPGAMDSISTAVEGDRALSVSLFERVFREGDKMKTYQTVMHNGGVDPSAQWIRLLPEGWFRQNAAGFLQTDNGMIGVLNSTKSPALQAAALSKYLADREASLEGTFHGQMARRKAIAYKNIGQSFLGADAHRALLRTALIAAQHRAATGKTLMSLDELSPELKARVPRGPMHDDLPAISRDADGVWTLSFSGYGENPKPETNPSLGIRVW